MVTDVGGLRGPGLGPLPIEERAEREANYADTESSRWKGKEQH